MATWPASIPTPLARAYETEFGRPTARPEFGRGWTSPQELATRSTKTVAVVFELSREQARDLVLFLRDHASARFTLALRLVEGSDETTPALAKFADTRLVWRRRAAGYEVRGRLEVET